METRDTNELSKCPVCRRMYQPEEDIVTVCSLGCARERALLQHARKAAETEQHLADAYEDYLSGLAKE